MNSPINKNNDEYDFHNIEIEEHVKKRMRERDFEARISQRQRELLLEAFGPNKSLANMEKQALLDEVIRQYCELYAQQGCMRFFRLYETKLPRN